jgi:MFS family permease
LWPYLCRIWKQSSRQDQKEARMQGMAGRAATTDAIRGRSGTADEPRATVPVALFWMILTCAALYGYAFGDPPGQITVTTDDAVRLVQVRDLIAGQGWFDLHQHRLGLGAGTEMHWSRLVDVPIAALILALSPFFGTEGAETTVFVIWPLFLLLPCIACAALLGRRFAGSRGMWAASAIMAAALSFSEKFYLGAIDHHNVQIVLVLLAVTFAAHAARSAQAAAGMGISLAVCLAIGAETLPHVAVLAGWLGFSWVVFGGKAAPATRTACAAFLVTLMTAFLATAPASAWRGGYCDGLTRDVALPLGVAAAGLLAAVIFLSHTRTAVRLAAALLTGAVGLAAAALAAPACLSDPLAEIHPFLRMYWLDRVSETRTLPESIVSLPHFILPTLVAGVLAVGAGILLARQSAGNDRSFWLLMVALVLVSLAVTSWQLRGTAILLPLAAVPGAVGVARLWVRYEATRRRRDGLLAIALLFLALPPATAATMTQARSLMPGQAEKLAEGSIHGFIQCVTDGQFEALAALPRGRVSSSSNLGSYVLMLTPHDALSAPYHRNVAGMTEQLRIALGTDDEAQARLREAEVHYVLVCPEDGEYMIRDTDGFAMRLARGEVPDFLEPVDLAATGTTLSADPPRLMIFRLLPHV